MKQFLILLLLVFLHTLPLWNYTENLAGGLGDPLAHAAIGDWFCNNIVSDKPHTDTYQAPYGVDLSGNYDSPFPFIATCAFIDFGPIFQFHLFTILQLILIIISSLLVARHFIKDKILQFAYVLFVWWTSYYICKAHEHMTLLSQIWGTQFVFYSILSLNLKSIKSILVNCVLLALSFIGTFQNIPGLFILTIGLCIYKGINNNKDLKSFRTISYLIIGLILSLTIFIVAWYPMIDFYLHNEILLRPDSLRKFYSLNLIDLIMPYKDNYISLLFDSKFQNSEKTNSLDFFIMFAFLISIFSKKFWKQSLNIVLIIVGSLYLFLAFGPELKINSYLYQYFPFKLTRTPSRLAIEFYFCILLITFLYFDQLQSIKIKKYLNYSLLVWIFINGPLMNQMFVFPTTSISKFIPANGLEEFKKMPDDQIVAHIPSAWAGDQSQNFLQLYHQKKITSAYLAYPAYTKELYLKSIQSPFLGYTGCKNQPLEFMLNPTLSDFDLLKTYLVENKITLFIFNKNLLFNEPSCKEIADWSLVFLKQPWIKIIEENDAFVLARISY